jgi:hypothetical protein
MLLFVGIWRPGKSSRCTCGFGGPGFELLCGARGFLFSRPMQTGSDVHLCSDPGVMWPERGLTTNPHQVSRLRLSRVK